jgi:heparin/heparan-sulfate lyase
MFARVLFGLCCTQLAAQNYPPPSFLPPAEHPRVNFRARDLPLLKANATKAQNAAAWKAQLKNIQAGTDGALPGALKGGTNADSRVLAVIESLAFDFALRGDRENGRKAVAAMRNYARTVKYPASDYNNAGQEIFTIGIVYDWCYPLLSEEDRAELYRGFLAAAPKLEVGWPPVKQGDLVGHGPEGQLMRDLMSAALAMYDEHPEIYRAVAGRFLGGMTEFKKFVYRGHVHPQGSHYGDYRGQWEMLATWLFDRMGLPEVFGPDQRYFPYWTLYARRPDGQMFRDGDSHGNNGRLGSYDNEPARTLFLAANYFNDPYLKGEVMRELPGLTPLIPKGNQTLNPVEILVFNKPELEPRGLEDLPLTHYFPSPKGAMIARTGWGAASAVVEMKINEWYTGNHAHLDAGAFQIYYRGSLATDTGYYQAAVNVTDSTENNGSSGYASAHDFNYNKRSIAHNTMNVFDPAERFETRRWKGVALANDGGERLPNRWEEPQHMAEFLDAAKEYRTGEVLGHGFGPDSKTPEYTYLKGDLARAYSAKVKAYERSFVFLNLKRPNVPAALLVFDRVETANPKLRKTWLLHGIEQPEVRGSRTLFRDTRPGYTGTLTVDTLLPEQQDLRIESVGGPGKEAWVNGVNYSALTRPEGNNEGGGWRIEVSPKAARETDDFLNVLQMGENGGALAVERIEAGTHVGARLGDRVVLFGKKREREASPVTFGFDGAGPFKILVSGLAAGSWGVERDGRTVGTASVTSEEGVAYFEGAPGRYRLARGSGQPQ